MNQENIEFYIQKTFDKYPKEYEGISYVICFLWSLDWKKMVDSWNFSANYVDDRSWPLSDNIVYEDWAISTGSWIASWSTLIILGYEEKLRRQSSNLENYLDWPLPKLPLEIVNGKDFFTDK